MRGIEDEFLLSRIRRKPYHVAAQIIRDEQRWRGGRAKHETKWSSQSGGEQGFPARGIDPPDGSIAGISNVEVGPKSRPSRPTQRPSPLG